MIPLSTFPPALLRLILCGGGGLPPAWGPLAVSDLPDSAPFTLWHGDPRGPLAKAPFRHTFVPMEVPEAWSLPLALHDRPDVAARVAAASAP